MPPEPLDQTPPGTILQTQALPETLPRPLSDTLQPPTESDLADAIRAARAPLTPIGGGTRLMPGEGQGARLSTAALTGITLYEPAALTLVARAGTPLAEIEAALSAEGQRVAFEPPPAPGSTIGGVVAANASGPRRVKDGAARDSLIGVRFVDGRGEVIANGGRVMKNVTGYDLVKLMAGSRGTLGVLTEVAFKTQPIPPATHLLTLPHLDAAAAIPALTAALTGPWDVTAAAWTPQDGALIRIEGLAASVKLRAETLAQRLLSWGEVLIQDAPFPDLRSQNILGGEGAKPPTDRWRILCRPSQAATLLARLPMPVALDWGGSLIWADLPTVETPDLTGTTAQAQRLTGASPLTLPPMTPAVAALNAGLRAQFDPRGIFAGAG